MDWAQIKMDSKNDKFKCSICGACYDSKETLDTHVESDHNKVKTYRCPECNRTFNRMYHLKRHIQIHDNPQSILDSVVPDTNEVCKICGEKFTKRHYLRDHIAKAHMSPRQYKCDVCGGEFKTEHILKQHQQKMHGENAKKYKCELCDEIFCKMSDLSNHKHEKHPKPYICEKCGNCFARKTNLTEHMKKHDKPRDARKMFHCPVEGCNSSFTRKSNLQTHIDTIHKNVLPYACEKCGKDFRYPSLLQKHMEIAHGDVPEPIIMEFSLDDLGINDEK